MALSFLGAVVGNPISQHHRKIQPTKHARYVDGSHRTGVRVQTGDRNAYTGTGAHR